MLALLSTSRSRESKLKLRNNFRPRNIAISAAALILLCAITAAAVLHICGVGYLTLTNPKTGDIYGRYLVKKGDTFSVGFVHSVNKSPLTDYYELRDDGIYVVKTVYYGFGAGVESELGEGETLEYGDDGSMIVTGFEKRIDNLGYIVGTVSDHILTINEKKEISLRDLCGRSARVHFSYEKFL